MHDVMRGNLLLSCSKSLCTLVNKCKWLGKRMVDIMGSFSFLLKLNEVTVMQVYICSSVLQICSWKEGCSMYQCIKCAYFRKVIENIEVNALRKSSYLETKLCAQDLLKIPCLHQFCFHWLSNFPMGKIVSCPYSFLLGDPDINR